MFRGALALQRPERKRSVSQIAPWLRCLVLWVVKRWSLELQTVRWIPDPSFVMPRVGRLYTPVTKNAESFLMRKSPVNRAKREVSVMPVLLPTTLPLLFCVDQAVALAEYVRHPVTRRGGDHNGSLGLGRPLLRFAESPSLLFFWGSRRGVKQKTSDNPPA